MQYAEAADMVQWCKTVLGEEHNPRVAYQYGGDSYAVTLNWPGENICLTNQHQARLFRINQKAGRLQFAFARERTSEARR